MSTWDRSSDPLELVRSLLQFPSRVASIGIDEFARVSGPPHSIHRSRVRGRAERVVAADAAAGTSLRDWLAAGNNLQAGIVDLLSSPAALQSIDLGQATNVAVDFLSHPVESLCCLVPDQHTPVVVEEFRNKAEVFSWVINAQSIMGLPDSSHYVSLVDLVRHAYQYDAFQALWLVEGLGHYYADASWERGETPEDILTRPDTRDLPLCSLTMLHAGLGLSYGDRLLKTIDADSPLAEVRKVIGQFVCLCEANSRPGYTGAAFESLGLVSQVFHPILIDVVERVIIESYPEIFDYYWHGLGRGNYFSLPYFLPFCETTAKGLRHSRNMSHCVTSQKNAVAGFAWGITMVNLESSLVLATLIASLRQADFDDGAFSYGLWSSLLMRENTTPGAPFIEDFVRYCPPAYLADRWRQIVACPSLHALEITYPELLRTKQFEQLFRFGGIT